MSNSTEFKLAENIAVLTRTPAALNALLRELPPLWIHGTEGEGTWSAFDIVGHLVSGERSDWLPRVRLLLEHGEARPFPPFDRFAQFQASQDKTLQQLLTDFACLRGENLGALQALNVQPQDMNRHLHQLSRVMAHQYRDLAGPWSAYLGVLQCTGHSAT